jgi:glycosyltransferase involved in cell wall biosynthesis
LSGHLTLVIPIFNDLESLEALLLRIEEIDDSNFDFLIVDNGSSDENVFNRIKNGGQNWSGIRTHQNLGFGGGILFGIHSSKSPWVGWMPGNLKIDPRDLTSFVSKVDFQPHTFIKASRVGRKPSAKLKTLIAGVIQSLLLRKKMLDTGGTPSICEKEFITNLSNPPQDYVFESFVYYAAKRDGLDVCRPKIHYGERLFGNSHWQSGILAEISLMRKIVIGSRSWR